MIYRDMVKETVSTTGTGSFTLAGAVTGFRPFSDVGDGGVTCYHREDSAGNWENGIGTYTLSGTTLSRDTVLSNSLGTTAHVVFADTTGFIDLTIPAALVEGVLLPNVATTNVTLASGNQYLANCGAALFVGTLPATCPINGRIVVNGNIHSTGGWNVAQLAGQIIYLAGYDGHTVGTVTTLGALGYLSSGNPGSSVELVCIKADTDFLITHTEGTVYLN